jgi:hypothetical protein
MITAAALGLGQRTVIIRGTDLAVEDQRVHPRLSVAEVYSLPAVMENDGASG